MNWNPDTSQITLPPTSNLTTPAPELFPPEPPPPDGICANTAKPGDLIEVIYPNDTQVIYRYVGAIEVMTSADVRVLIYDQWGKVSFGDSIYYPATQDTPTTETLIYSPPALSVPLPYGVTPEMVTNGMITGGEVQAWYDPTITPSIDGCPCVVASKTEFQDISRKVCYHEENIEESESEWNALPPELGVGLCISKMRRILSTYTIMITFPFPRQSPPPLAPILAALGVLSLCLIGAAGAGNAAANTLKRRHQIWQP